MDCKTDLIRTRHPTRFTERKIQEEIQSYSLSRRSFQEECLRVESIRGAPIYFEGREEALNPKILVIFL